MKMQGWVRICENGNGIVGLQNDTQGRDPQCNLPVSRQEGIYSKDEDMKIEVREMGMRLRLLPWR